MVHNETEEMKIVLRIYLTIIKIAHRAKTSLLMRSNHRYTQRTASNDEWRKKLYQFLTFFVYQITIIIIIFDRMTIHIFNISTDI